MSSMFLSKAFWTDTVDRVLVTTVQVAIASIGSATLFHEVQWDMVGSAAALGAVLAFGSSVIGHSARAGRKHGAISD